MVALGMIGHIDSLDFWMTCAIKCGRKRVGTGRSAAILPAARPQFGCGDDPAGCGNNLLKRVCKDCIAYFAHFARATQRLI
jgi:hypothetical protein